MPQLKTFNQSLERMRNNFALEFTSNPADVSLRFMEVTADEDDALYGAIIETLASFYVGTATGSDLDNRMGDLGHYRKQGFRATTMLTFGTDFPAEQQITIPTGTAVSTVSGVTFNTTAQAIIAVGQSYVLNVPAQATQMGEAYNVKANTIVTIVGNGALNVTRVTNPYAVANGQEVEKDPEYRGRFPDYIKSLARGTVPAVRSATISVDGVTDLYIREQAEGTGSFYVYIDDGNGGTVSSIVNAIYQDLVDDVTEKLEVYRSGGVKMLVKPVGRVLIDVDLHLIVELGYNRATVEADVVECLLEYLNDKRRSESVTATELLTQVYSIPGVIDKDPANPTDMTHIDLPVNEVVLEPWEIARPGVISVS